ncbi:hypothetical protein P8452_61231 [Trifolium repens]|nr:hypothetical protein P8452_61231 [Trifolium repens]
MVFGGTTTDEGKNNQTLAKIRRGVNGFETLFVQNQRMQAFNLPFPRILLIACEVLSIFMILEVLEIKTSKIVSLAFKASLQVDRLTGSKDQDGADDWG